jgi:abortive infection bacteriophage resistance protein
MLNPSCSTTFGLDPRSVERLVRRVKVPLAYQNVKSWTDYANVTYQSVINKFKEYLSEQAPERQKHPGRICDKG